MSDYHLHLHPHRMADSDPPPDGFSVDRVERYVEAAASRGVTELGFTEHLYRCAESEAALGPFWEREPRADLAAHTEQFVRRDRGLVLAEYVEAVTAAKDRGLPVRLGLEVDFFPETIGDVVELLAPYPWDFLIGSVHWVGGWAIDSGEVSYEFERRGVDRSWEEYFALETELAASGVVDVLAHVDVCKKYGHRPDEEPIHLYRPVVEAAARTGTAVEVSSQGLRKPVGAVYPSPVFLRLFHDAGVPITLASDAHEADEAGWGHDEVVAAARDAGYAERLGFEARHAVTVPLDG